MTRQPLSAGTVLQDRYTIEKHIAFASLGSVYLATDADRACEYRLLAEVGDERVATDSAAVAAYSLEAELISEMKHVSLPTYFDHVGLTDRYCVVRDYLPGMSLNEEVHRRGGRLDES